MRGRFLNVFWVVVIVVILAASCGVPPLRERIRGPFEPDYLAVAEERPDDATAWLAALSHATHYQLSASELARIYHHASELDPRSPVPHLLFAVRVMPGSLLRREGMEALKGQPGGYDWLNEQPLTAQERQDLAGAEKALGRASELDPGNAAVDYLHAYAALVDHRDEDAFAHLRRAFGKHSWNTYRRDARIAVYRTGLKFLPMLEASSIGVRTTAITGIRFLELPQLLIGMAILAQRAGDHSSAICLRQSVMHQAQLMLSNAYDIFDVKTAVLAWIFATRPASTEPDAGTAHHIAGGSGSGSASQDPGIVSAQATWPRDAVKIAEYFREHGREDLAEEVASWTSAMQAGYERTDLYRERSQALASKRALLFRSLAWLAVALVGSLLLLVVCGFAAAALWFLRHPVRQISWLRWGWLLIVFACLGAVAATGLVWSGEPLLLRSSPAWQRLQELAQLLGAESPPVPWSLRPWGGYFVVIGLPLLAVTTLMGVLLHRRRHPEARGVGPLRQWLGTLLPLLVPLTALLSIGTLALAISSSVAARRQAEINRMIIYQGEVGYYEQRREQSLPDRYQQRARPGLHLQPARIWGTGEPERAVPPRSLP